MKKTKEQNENNDEGKEKFWLKENENSSTKMQCKQKKKFLKNSI